MNRRFVRFLLIGAGALLLGLMVFLGIRLIDGRDPPPEFNPADLAQRPILPVDFVATELAVVEGMLQIAGVTRDDVVLDLGSGDGRIPIAAARSRGARGIGVDLDPQLIARSHANARAAGVANRVQFRQQDFFVTPLTEATVVTLYLLPEINLQLRPRLLSELRPGTRVVSNSWDMGDWRPDAQAVVANANIFLWIVPAQVAGTWQVTMPDGETGTLTLTQSYQQLAGRLAVGGRTVDIAQARMTGDRISFTVDTGNGTQRFQGQVGESGIAGDGGWQAVRAAG